jgi:hypothetical protein
MRVLVFVLCVLLGVAVGAIIARTVPRPELSRKNRALLNDAAALLGRIRNPTRLDEIEVLSDSSKKATDQWLARYNKEFQ